MSRMTWPEWCAARQLLAEEFVGTRVREAEQAEQSKMDRGLSAVRRIEGEA